MSFWDGIARIPISPGTFNRAKCSILPNKLYAIQLYRPLKLVDCSDFLIVICSSDTSRVTGGEVSTRSLNLTKFLSIDCALENKGWPSKSHLNLGNGLPDASHKCVTVVWSFVSNSTLTGLNLWCRTGGLWPSSSRVAACSLPNSLLCPKHW